MAIAFVQAKTGLSTTQATSPAFDSAPTSGNLIVLSFSADAFQGTPDSGWTESSEMGQTSDWHGGYVWWRISDGSNPPGSYTLESTATSAWALLEFSGIDATPYLISEGAVNNSGSTGSVTTPAATVPAGDVLIIGALNGAVIGAYSGDVITAWTNSFVERAEIYETTGTIRHIVALGSLIATSSGGSYQAGFTVNQTTTKQCTHTIAFEASAGVPAIVARPSADDTDGGWTDSAAGTNLFAQLDETSASDADYIRSANTPSSDTCKIHLSDPGVSVTTPITLRVRYAKGGTGTINLTVKLFEGTTELWSKAYNGISASYVTATESAITLNQPISDETNLYVQFIATAA